MTNDELIQSAKEHIVDILQNHLNENKYKFLTKDFADKIKPNSTLRFRCNNFNWNEDKKLTNILNEYFSVNWYIPLQASGKLIITDFTNSEWQEYNHSFSLNINLWFHFDANKPSFSFDIHDNTKNILFEYNKEIEKISMQNGLFSILDENVQFDEKNSIVFFMEIIRNEKNKIKPFSDLEFDMHDDIVRSHQDIVFALGELCAYAPYTTSLIEHSVKIEDNVLFQYFPSFCDKRYLSLCNRLFELFYIFWDKIGDLLAPFFAQKFNTRDIYFCKVIDSISFIFHDNVHFLWLQNFKEAEFSTLNEKRKQVVHYMSIESEILKNYRTNSFDIIKLKEIQKVKEDFPTYFKTHYEISITGFYHALKLIESSYLKICE